MTDQAQIKQTSTGTVTVEPGTPYEAELFVESVITTFDAQEPPIIKIEQTEFYGVIKFADAQLNREDGEAWQTVGCIDETGAWLELWAMYDDLTRAFTAVRLEKIAERVRREIAASEKKPAIAAQEPPYTQRNAMLAGIPQAVYDWYNAMYSNETYSVVRKMLMDSTSDQELTLIMNMLTDAALERSGATFYAGMTAYLYEQIARYNCGSTQLLQAAEAHLRRFNRYSEEQLQEHVRVDGRNFPASHAEFVRTKETHGGKR